MPPLFEATLVKRGHVREDSKGGVPMKAGKADREMSRRDFLKLGIAGSMVAVLLFAIGCLGGGDDDGDDEDDDDGGRRRGRRRRR
jgi:hypothetical protein